MRSLIFKRESYILLCIFCAFIYFPTYGQNLAKVKIRGTIVNPSTDSIFIKNLDGDLFASAKLSTDNSFNCSFQIKPGYYKFADGKESASIYLDDGYDLNITLTTDSFDETLRYSGKGSDINNYLARKYLMEEKWGKMDYYDYYLKLDETEFLNLVDSLNDLSLNLLKSMNFNNPRFTKLEQAGFENYRIYKLNLFMLRNKGGDKYSDTEVSINFPNPWKDFDINSAENIDAEYYLGNITSYLGYIAYSDDKTTPADFVFAIIQVAGDSVKNLEVRDAMLYQFCKYRLTMSKELDKSFQLYKKYAINLEHITEIEKIYLARKKTQTGAVSPAFSFEDIDGKQITNEDLKGKLLYIDVWATWCGPCLREIPYFDTLQRQFEGRKIQFVSISYQDNKERWQKMVKEKELLGIQLFATDSKAPFFTDYQVEGIPRYILIDAKGIIIDSDAKRPSDNELKNFLNTQLQKLEE